MLKIMNGIIAYRYHFYLDCMLVDDMPTLDEKQQEVIILSATRQDFMKYEFKHLSSVGI